MVGAVKVADLPGGDQPVLNRLQGSGMGASEREIKKTCPGATVKPGLPVTGSRAADSAESVKRWLFVNGLL